MTARCYVCEKNPLASQKDTTFRTLAYRVTCPRCGTYEIAQALLTGDKNRTHLTPLERVSLSHAIRKATDAHGLFGEPLEYPTIKALVARHPLPKPPERADLLIAAVADLGEFYEWTPAEPGETWAARIAMKELAQVGALQMAMEKFITWQVLPNQDLMFKLTLEGWIRVDEIRRERGPGKQAFVAMWFAPQMNVIYDEGIAPALVDTGWQPYRVDRAPHNNKIDDEIIAETRRSNLMVVDATGARISTYWEAGMAAGLAIPVIWCCNESWPGYVLDLTADGVPVPKPCKWPEALAFDTRQNPCIFWSDQADLRKKLTYKIRSMSLDAAWNRGQ